MGVNTISQENTNNNGFNNFVGTEKWGKVNYSGSVYKV